jgi:hypothetical protein
MRACLWREMNIGWDLDRGWYFFVDFVDGVVEWILGNV